MLMICIENIFCLFVCLFLVFFGFFRSMPMEVPRLGVKSELQLLAYSTDTATQDLSHRSATYTTAHGNTRSPTC